MPDTRRLWIDTLWKLAEPVLNAAAAGKLHASMPLRCAAGADQQDRALYSHLEAIARTLAGLAPWLDCAGGDAAEQELRRNARSLAQQALRNAFDPQHPDRVNVHSGQQPIVDAAFVAHAVLRAPRSLADGLDAGVRSHLADALAATRDRLPYQNNWLLFAALIEAALHRLGRSWDPMRVDHALRSHERWYAGDGAYGDGARFHWDYYNSFVIQPMLIDLLDTVPEPAGASGAWTAMRPVVLARFQRMATVQERLIGCDGCFPPIGRSLVYRCGAFQLLSQAALQHRLPANLPPAQVRCALTAVIRRTLEAPGTWDGQGWLMPGLCGQQPGLMESYISTGSLYLASTAFLPLGLPPDDAFWSGPDLPWTQQRVWSGEDLAADHALYD
jgi:hypothetical protein